MFGKKHFLVVRGGTPDKPFSKEQMKELMRNFKQVAPDKSIIFVRGDVEVYEV